MTMLYVTNAFLFPFVPRPAGTSSSTGDCLGALMGQISSTCRSNSRTLSPNAGWSSSSSGLCWVEVQQHCNHTALLSRVLPGDPPETAGSSFQKPPGTATHSKEVFLPSSSCSQPELNKPQGKPRDTNTSAGRFCRNSSWDGWDSAASERGGIEQEPPARMAFWNMKFSNSGFIKPQDLPSVLHPTPL